MCKKIMEVRENLHCYFNYPPPPNLAKYYYLCII